MPNSSIPWPLYQNPNAFKMLYGTILCDRSQHSLFPPKSWMWLHGWRGAVGRGCGWAGHSTHCAACALTSLWPCSHWQHLRQWPSWLHLAWEVGRCEQSPGAVGYIWFLECRSVEEGVWHRWCLSAAVPGKGKQLTSLHLACLSPNANVALGGGLWSRLCWQGEFTVDIWWMEMA